MKFILCLFVALGFLTACSSSDSGSNKAPCYATCMEKPFAGEPVNLNGAWTGTGSAVVQGQKYDKASFFVQISGLPSELEVSLRVMKADGTYLFTISLAGNAVENNIVMDAATKTNRGSAGAGGFVLQYQVYNLSALLVAAGVVQLDGKFTAGNQDYSFNGSLQQAPAKP